MLKFGKKPKLTRKTNSASKHIADVNLGAVPKYDEKPPRIRKTTPLSPIKRDATSGQNLANGNREPDIIDANAFQAVGKQIQSKPDTLGHALAAEPAKYQDTSSDSNDIFESKLLKPIPSLGFDAEFRELAQIIQRDIFIQNPNVKWDSISGVESSKRLIKESIVYPLKYPQLFTGMLHPWNGILLYGPPGTGKTMLAKAVATECKTTFFNISASSIVSKWRGDSEKLIRVLFQMARYHSPSTIFLDELESIMGHRNGGAEHEGSRRMKTELLIQVIF